MESPFFIIIIIVMIHYEIIVKNCINKLDELQCFNLQNS
jgi:hypothetical protein